MIQATRSEGGDHRVVGRLAVGVLERAYGLDSPCRPRVWRLGAVPFLQRGKKRKLVRLRVSARRRVPSPGHFGRERSKTIITRAADNGPSLAARSDLRAYAGRHPGRHDGLDLRFLPARPCSRPPCSSAADWAVQEAGPRHGRAGVISKVIILHLS